MNIACVLKDGTLVVSQRGGLSGRTRQLRQMPTTLCAWAAFCHQLLCSAASLTPDPRPRLALQVPPFENSLDGITIQRVMELLPDVSCSADL